MFWRNDKSTLLKLARGVAERYAEDSHVESVVLNSFGNDWIEVIVYLHGKNDAPVGASHADEWVDEKTKVSVRAAFRSVEGVRKDLENVLVKFQARLGCSTCVWRQVLGAQILFDRSGWFEKLQEFARQDYPDELRQAIVDLNFSVLRQSLSSYVNQMKRSRRRKDWVMLNDLVSKFLASYFDIIFAFNKVPHTGEKDLLKMVSSECKQVPQLMKRQVNGLIKEVVENPGRSVHFAELLVDNLTRLLSTEELARYKPKWSHYALSLPERGLKIFSAGVGGLAYELSDLIMPSAVKNSRIYNSMITRSFQIVVELLGGVQGVFGDEDMSGGSFMARKTVGNLVEAGGVLAMGFSPLWVMAAISDISGGTKAYLQELVKELKKSGLVAENMEAGSVNQLLSVLEKTSEGVANTVDLPPLGIKDLKKMVKEFKEGASQLPSGEELHEVYGEFKEIAKHEKRSLKSLSMILALSAHRAGMNLGKVYVLDYYRQALREIREEGLRAYVMRTVQPYRSAIGRHLKPGSMTWTERLLIRKRS